MFLIILGNEEQRIVIVQAGDVHRQFAISFTTPAYPGTIAPHCHAHVITACLSSGVWSRCMLVQFCYK